jgi:PLP dependent protein
MSVLTPLQLQHNLAQLQHTIATAAQQFGRNLDDIQWIAVSKTRTVQELNFAIECGLRQFGENYVQEALPKIHALPHDLVWHFIGPIQSNKTRLIAENFDWVQSVDSLKHAQRLDKHRPSHLPPLNLCIQVNISREPQKSGIAPEELIEFATHLANLPHLKLRGLMAIPEYHESFEQQRHSCRQLNQAYQQLQDLGFALDTLSIGMTDDMVAAIAEGATLLRIGTGLFGERLPAI